MLGWRDLARPRVPIHQRGPPSWANPSASANIQFAIRGQTRVPNRTKLLGEMVKSLVMWWRRDCMVCSSTISRYYLISKHESEMIYAANKDIFPFPQFLYDTIMAHHLHPLMNV